MNATTPAHIRGAVRSVTMWVAGVLISLGQIAPFVNAQMLSDIGIDDPKQARLVLGVCGLIMWACRLITKNSLADKVGVVAVIPAAPAAPSISVPSPISENLK